MSMDTAIEWTDATWNPTTGCTKISPGCAHCYIERTPPFRIGGRRFVKGATDLQLHDNRLDAPLHWRRPRRVFVNSLSDLYHDGIPFAFLEQVFRTMSAASWHQFQVLTKRSSRLRALSPQLPWPSNVWQGVSVENSAHVFRISDLQAVPAAVRFLSVEPLLGPIPNVPLAGISWVIVGGESGPGRRPMDSGWVRDIRDQCLSQSVAFFFKQWGGRTPKALGRELDGRTWDEMPTHSGSSPLQL